MPVKFCDEVLSVDAVVEIQGIGRTNCDCKDKRIFLDCQVRKKGSISASGILYRSGNINLTLKCLNIKHLPIFF
jgi:hypothetical protein